MNISGMMKNKCKIKQMIIHKNLLIQIIKIGAHREKKYTPLWVFFVIVIDRIDLNKF